VQVLGRRAHGHRRGVDQALGDEARVEVDVLAHGVVAHVLDASREHDVGRTHCDLARRGGDGGEGAGAHPVDGEAGHGLRDSREQRDVATEREPLVADLGGGGEDHVADALRRKARVPPQHLAHDLDGHVVGSRPPEDSLRARTSEGRPAPVHVHDLAKLARHQREPSG